MGLPPNLTDINISVYWSGIFFPRSKKPCSISTGLTTLDAMLQKLSTFRITAKCKGDVWIDEHHSTEDVMITVGSFGGFFLGAFFFALFAFFRGLVKCGLEYLDGNME